MECICNRGIVSKSIGFATTGEGYLCLKNGIGVLFNDAKDLDDH